MVANVLSLCLPPYLNLNDYIRIGVVGIFTATCQSIVTIMVIYSDHGPPLVYVAFP